MGLKNTLTSLVFAGVISVGLTGKVDGANYIETRVTNNPSAQGNAAISGDNIVWIDYRNGDEDIYMTSSSTGEIPICTSDGHQYNPAIFGNTIVWDSTMIHGLSDIYLWNPVIGERQLTNSNHANYPSIYKDKIVWVENGLRLYDLSTGQSQKISNDSILNYSPSIYEDKVVWEHWGEGLPPSIYGWDPINGERKLTPDSSIYALYPKISGDNVVYCDRRNGNFDIFLLNMISGEEKQITDNQADQILPSINEGNIVWQDYRDGTSQIYMWNHKKGEQQITNNEFNQGWASIDKDKIIYTSTRYGNMDIYMTTIPEPSTLYLLAISGLAGLGYKFIKNRIFFD
jgi:TolB protein